MHPLRSLTQARGPRNHRDLPGKLSLGPHAAPPGQRAAKTQERSSRKPAHRLVPIRVIEGHGKGQVAKDLTLDEHLELSKFVHGELNARGIGHRRLGQ